jgi:hypothetical protein
MAQNEVQFQQGLSTLMFFDLYGSLERCKEAGAVLALAIRSNYASGSKRRADPRTNEGGISRGAPSKRARASWISE